VPLFLTSHKTPIGTLNLIAREDVLLSANLSTISAAKASLDEDDRLHGFKEVKTIPVISELIDDYFDGDRQLRSVQQEVRARKMRLFWLFLATELLKPGEHLVTMPTV